MQDALQRLRANISRVFLGGGNPLAIDQVVCCLLAKGHILIEDVPGVGKTILATALARSIDCSFSRIQLTPDLLPSDILGVSVYSREPSGNGSAASGPGRFEFKKGPIFANIVLADEINRTPPRTQTALLEAMSEANVTIDGRSYRLEQPFMIIATQNPHDFEGTYVLPENQLDRFFMRIGLGYPDADTEARVLTERPADTGLASLQPVLSAAEVLTLQRKTDEVRVDQSLIEYIVAFAAASRRRDDLQYGLSPRASLALAQAARATAVLSGRDYAIPEDITRNILPVCAHRVASRTYVHSRSSASRSGGEPAPDSPEGILTQIMESVPSPA